MLRAISLFLCLLSGFPTMASPESGTKKPQSAQPAAMPVEFPKFYVGDGVSLTRWILPRITISDDGYSEGERIAIRLNFTVKKNGRMKGLTLESTTDEGLAKKVMAEISKIPRWIPNKDNGFSVANTQKFGLDLLLVRGTDGRLHATDNKAYSGLGSKLMFKGESIRYFRSWIKGQVDSLLGVDDARKNLRVHFIIEKDGSVNYAVVPKDLNSEVARVIGKAMQGAPYWTPVLLDGEAVRYSMLLTVGLGAAELTDEETADDAWVTPELMPRFMGGTLSYFRTWVMKNVQYPMEMLQQKIQGRVVVSFTIERDGSLTNIKVLETPHPLFSEAVSLVLSQAPKWVPGMSDGSPVRVSYTLPVDFRTTYDAAIPPSQFAPLPSPHGGPMSTPPNGLRF